MPRITISRVLGLVPLIWVCLVGTWFFLPSPVVPPYARDEYVQNHLRHGSTVTTISEYGESFKFRNDPHGRQCNECSGLIINWRLESNRATDSLVLHIGDQSKVNLTEAAIRGPAAGKPDDEKTPYLSDSFGADVYSGGTGHPTILPWFRWTDKVLIDWTMHGWGEGLRLRVFSPEPGVVEVWKDIDMWQTYRPGDPVRETEREVGLLASFSHVPGVQFSGIALTRANTANVEISKVQGTLPSRTWSTRSIIAGPLYVPTFALSVIMWSFTFDTVPLTVILAFQMLCIILVFIRLERINLSRIRCPCSERTKRPKERGIWGAAGPISDEESGLLAINSQKPMSMFPHAISKPSRSRAPVFDKV
ncbi:hypothetical protein AB5N19_13362 [Seiridium cardinale]